MGPPLGLVPLYCPCVMSSGPMKRPGSRRPMPPLARLLMPAHPSPSLASWVWLRSVGISNIYIGFCYYIVITIIIHFPQTFSMFCVWCCLLSCWRCKSRKLVYSVVVFLSLPVVFCCFFFPQAFSSDVLLFQMLSNQLVEYNTHYFHVIKKNFIKLIYIYSDFINKKDQTTRHVNRNRAIYLGIKL